MNKTTFVSLWLIEYGKEDGSPNHWDVRLSVQISIHSACYVNLRSALHNFSEMINQSKNLVILGKYRNHLSTSWGASVNVDGTFETSGFTLLKVDWNIVELKIRKDCFTVVSVDIGENGATGNFKDWSIWVLFINKNWSLTALSTLNMFFMWALRQNDFLKLSPISAIL